jgi:SAM-dependent methyltransferase
MKATALKQVSYDPSVFDIETVEEAMRVIVTPEAGMSTKLRWERETLALLDLIEKHSRLSEDSCVLDWGCGIGRLAKPLIAKHRCEIIGVDISPSMRALANCCVGAWSFMAMPPEMLGCLLAEQCELALAVWTLQHVLDLRSDVANIDHMLRPGGRLFVVNNVRRVVPSAAGWLDDEIDVRAMLQDIFVEIEYGQLPEEIAPGSFRDNTFWAVYQK